MIFDRLLASGGAKCKLVRVAKASNNVYKIVRLYTWKGAMRTNIEIDNELMERAMTATGKPTKKATIEEALRQVILNQELRQAIQDMKGIGWEGNLEAMRNDDVAY